MGKTTIKNNSGDPVSIFMVAFSATPGEVLSKYIKIEKIALSAFKKLGEALGELHSKERNEIPHSEFLATLKLNHIEMLKNIKNYPKKEIANGKLDDDIVKMYQSIDKNLLADYMAHLTSNFSGNIPVGLIHGDAHLKNFLYDPVTEALSMIDLGQLTTGIVTKDFYNILEHIQAGKVSNEEKDRLEKVFIEGYEEGGGLSPCSELLDLLSLDNQLVALKSHEWIDYYSPDTKRMVKAIIKRNYDNLMSSLENFAKSRER